MTCSIKRIFLLLCYLWPGLTVAEDDALVQVEEVVLWPGVSQNLFCNVSPPVLNHVVSHAEAQLKWVLPVGTKVDRGQLIAEQDGFYLNRQLSKLKLDVQLTDVELRQSETELERYRNIADSDFISESAVEKLELTKLQLQLAKNIKQENLTELRHRADKLQIRADVSGEIITNIVAPGSYLGIGDEIMVIQPDQDMELICDVPVDTYTSIAQKLDLAKFSFGVGSLAKFLRVSRNLREVSQTLRLFLKPTSGAEKLFFGQRLSVHMLYEQEGLVLLPFDALVFQNAQPFVRYIDNDNLIGLESIDIVALLSDKYLVKSKFVGGEKVVTESVSKLRKGQKVKIDPNR